MKSLLHVAVGVAAGALLTYIILPGADAARAPLTQPWITEKGVMDSGDCSTADSSSEMPSPERHSPEMDVQEVVQAPFENDDSRLDVNEHHSGFIGEFLDADSEPVEPGNAASPSRIGGFLDADT